MFVSLLHPRRVRKDARTLQRTRITGPVLVTIDGDTLRGRLEDLSTGGARIWLEGPILSHEWVDISFAAAPEHWQHAQCRWSRPDGGGWVAGLEFEPQDLSRSFSTAWVRLLQ